MPSIKELREARGWTVRGLADELGVDKMTVWKWEHGWHVPSGRSLHALAKTFGVSMDEIDFEGPARRRGEGGGGDG